MILFSFLKFNSFFLDSIEFIINLYFCLSNFVFMRNKIIFSLILIIGLIFAYNYAYPDHRSIQDEPVSYTLDAASFFNEFKSDSHQAELKYLDQTVVVSGLITSVNTGNITISNKIYCQFEALNSDLKVNDSLAVKGRCIGFDDLLEEIKLDQCSIVK